MGKIALCVGKEREMCYMMYGGEYHFLNSVEMRQNFENAKVGQWFRVNIEQRKGRHTFESLEKSEAPPTRLSQDKDKSVIQVQLPIFFVWNRENDRSPDFRIYSPALDGRSLSVENYDHLDEIPIKPLVLYEAFLTLIGWDVGTPRWSLQFLTDIMMKCDKSGSVTKNGSSFLLSQKEAGVVLKLFKGSCLALVLCLRDGQLAIAISETEQSFSVGDYVHFCCREVDRPVQPSITSSKLYAVNLSLHNEGNIPAGTPSLPLTSLEEDKLFEISFSITNSMISSTVAIKGSIHVDNLGVLLDPDGLLSNQLTLERVGQLITVQARLCLVPERQSPLWFIVYVVCGQKEAKEVAKVMKKQSFDCTDEDDEQNGKTFIQSNDNKVKFGAKADKEFDIIDGGFGGGWKGPGKDRVDADAIVKREERNAVQENLNASIGELSISSNESIRSAAENLPISDGIALFIQMRSYEWILALFDNQIRKFTHWCCTLIKSLPLNPGQRSPIPGSWFKIGYAFYDTHQKRKGQKHILISSISPVQSDELPTQINPNNREVWDMVISGNFDCALKGGTAKINKQPPIPVTKVFSRANSEAPMENQQNSDNINRPCGSFCFKPTVPSYGYQRSLNTTRVERFFNVDYEMAGVVVGCLHAANPEINAQHSYRIWPFCTGTPTPRELTLNTAQLLQLGTWVKFDAECYRKGEIEAFNEIAHWLDTSVIEDPKAPKVCLECSIQIPQKYDPFSETTESAAIWTCRFKPRSPHVPFIKKLVPTDGLKPILGQYRGKFGLFARLEYRREFGGDGRTVGFWQIAELLTGMNRKNDLKDEQ